MISIAFFLSINLHGFNDSVSDKMELSVLMQMSGRL